MKSEITHLIIGIILFIIANLLAFVYKYNKFYLFLILGIFFIIKSSYKIKNKKEFLNKNSFFIIYLVFIPVGIIIDFLLGIYISKLWYYPNYTFQNYILLYLLIYPLGGFIMIYSFALLESIFIKRIKKTNMHKYALKISKIISLLSLIGLILTLILKENYKGFLIFAFSSLLILGVINYITGRIKKNNILEKLLTSPGRYLLIILAVSYIQGILHELPNTFAKEWIYINFPFEGVKILGVPIIVLSGWILLLIIPYSVYELILAFKIKKS